MNRWIWVVALVYLGACESSSPQSGELGEGDGVLHDPLSMPANPTLNPDDFEESFTCAPCHPTHADEWATSSHAYAMHDPVFRALVERRQEDLNETEDQFCTQCHTAIGTRGGEIPPGFSFDDLSDIALEGVTCVSCHKVVGMERLFNSGHVLDAAAPMMGGIADPQGTLAHDSEYSDLIQSPEFCGGCHDVVETNGLNLERPLEEWMESAAAGTDETCQSCHMPAREGQAVKEGPLRTIHSHRFKGVSVPLLEGFLPNDEVREVLRAEAKELLESSASLRLGLPEAVKAGTQLDVLVTIQNEITGHNLPSGSNFIRQVWLELTVTDGEGKVLYRTGHLDEDGNLRNIWSKKDPFGDPDLITLTSELLNSDGEPVLFTWDAVELVNRAISPMHERTYTLFVPVPEDAATPLELNAALQFRALPPYLLDELGLSQYNDQLEIVPMATTGASVDVE